MLGLRRRPRLERTSDASFSLGGRRYRCTWSLGHLAVERRHSSPRRVMMDNALERSAQADVDELPMRAAGSEVEGVSE